MARRRRGDSETFNPWPGYVDALSTLLMVIIFVLLVFVLSQAFLSVALSGRDKALDRVNRQMAELSDMLSLEKGRSQELKLSLAQLDRDLKSAVEGRDTLAQQLAGLRAQQARTEADRDGLRSDRDRLAAQLADADVQARAAQARIAQLQAASEDAARRGDATAQSAAQTQAALIEAKRQIASRDTDLSTARRQLADAQAALADTQSRLDSMRAQADELNRTVRADRATIEARLADLAKLAEQNRGLAALRDELEKQARDAAAKTVTEAQARAAVAAQLADEQKLSESGRAQIALLNRQMDELRTQMANVAKALDASEQASKEKDVQIVNLGSRLNAALAAKVEELQSYRSEFFGRLRQVLAGRQGVQVVGDRFVFQSEVLFPSGSADLSQSGIEQLFRLADTLRDIIKDIPADVKWILRVDGHADRQPISGGRFASNWELSAARAINVVKLLSVAGIPPEHLAATAFGDTQPIDAAETPDAFAKNRRLEFRLTDR
jgi:chemotaxis protein MotB